jgi:HD-GYP domain-containing protein (c-di-GMP phosphodiesterase class II)
MVLEAYRKYRPGLLEHSRQVSRYVVALGRRAGMPQAELDESHTAALLHDVGKLGIHPKLLDKAGRLTSSEYTAVQGHCALGEEMLAFWPELAGFARAVRHHHERWDGRGYPDGLAGEDIPLASRLIHLADAIDVMLRQRRYKAMYPVGRVQEELRICGGGQFDPKLAGVALAWIAQGGLDEGGLRKAA